MRVKPVDWIDGFLLQSSMSSTTDAKQGSFSNGTRHGDLPTELRRIAEEELGETDSGKEEALEKLTQLLQNEPDLDARTDPEFLLRFLRVRKYNVDATLNTIKNYYKSRVAFASTFKGLTPASVNPDAKELFIVMPERDRHGRLIILMRLGAWMPDVLPYCDVQQAGMMCLDHAAIRSLVPNGGHHAHYRLRGLQCIQDAFLQHWRDKARPRLFAELPANSNESPAHREGILRLRPVVCSSPYLSSRKK
uniref:Putative intracellular n=1 Tax=Ixodes ricinus TaxID=34613 RepID=A0A0K8R736_IXORI